MPQCTICGHSRRQEIDAALVAGTSLRNIAEQFSLSAAALCRHRKAHLPATLVAAQEAAEVAQADDLLSQVVTLKGRAVTILDKAEGCGDLRSAVAAIREARSCLELLGRLAGELREAQTTVNVLVASPEWLALRTQILQALEPYPEARFRLAGVLSGAH